MRFEDAWFFILLLTLPLLYHFGGRDKPLLFPTLGEVKRVRPSLRVRLHHLPKVFWYVALILIIISLARPQLTNREKEVTTKGTDILLTLDISGSMQAEDFKPKNRLHVAKEVLKGFIEGRKSDRIGLVAFAGEAFTQSPLTLDYGILITLIGDLEIGRFQDGTAIGMAIAESSKRLKDSEAETKIVILLTDGVNNSGNIDPVTAARMAKALGIKIYTIGVGREGGAPIPIMSRIFGKTYARDASGNVILTEINEEVLKEVANITDAKYYRATDKASLIKIYGEIDGLEKTDIKVKEFYSYIEIYRYFLFAALGFFILSTLLRTTWLRVYP